MTYMQQILSLESTMKIYMVIIMKQSVAKYLAVCIAEIQPAQTLFRYLCVKSPEVFF